MARLFVSHEARRDLVEIYLFIALDNAEAAERHHGRLEAAFRAIASQPKIGKQRNDLREGTRSLAVNNYVIYYRYTRSSTRILRVLHGARDIRSLFAED